MKTPRQTISRKTNPCLRKHRDRLAVGLLMLSLGGAAATDVNYYQVGKGQIYLQRDNGPAALKTGAPYFFGAQLVPTTNSLVYAASVATPGHLSWGLFQSYPSVALSFSGRFSSKSSLDSLDANGTYTFTFQAVHDGYKTLTLSLSGDLYPPAPHLSNLPAAQTIDTTVPFQVTWDAFAGGTASSFVQFWIENTSGQVFGTGARPGATNALNGTATSVTIPAGTLTAGHSYIGHLLFETFTSTNLTYAGAPGLAGYWRQTDFYLITTGPGDATPPILASSSPAMGATGVPVNLPVKFTFSKPMATGFSISVLGTTNSSKDAWSADGMIFTVTSTNNWPSNNQLLWLLNPSGGAPVIGDAQGNPLMSDTPLIFNTGTQMLPAVPTPPSFPAAPGFTNGQFHLAVQGEAYRTYVWQGSGDLTNWTSLATNSTTGTKIDFYAPFSSAAASAFFRVLALP